MKKNQLPTKICIVCKRPFNWRKKWSKVWNEVKYRSNACKKKIISLGAPKSHHFFC